MSVIIISCCGSKKTDSCFILDGQPIKFHANPNPSNSNEAHPDQIIPNSSQTYREYLIKYNQTLECDRTFKLPKAADLYSPQIYRELAHKFAHFYIFSAGWGIVRKDFCLPDHDITFSGTQPEYATLRKCGMGWNWHHGANMQESPILDFNHLAEDIASGHINADEVIHFAGGRKYQDPLIELIRSVQNNVVLWFKGRQKPLIEPSLTVRIKARKFETARNTNWHYEWARNCASGKLQLI